MKKTYFLSILFLTIIFLTACGNSSFKDSEKTAFDKVLNCEQAGKAMLLLTSETVAAFSGGEEANTYMENFITWCSNHPDVTILDCEAFSDTEFEYCVRSVGVWGDSLGCMDSADCKIAFASSHIEDCSSFKNEKAEFLGESYFDLKSVCLFSLAYMNRERDACDQIEQLSYAGASCDKEENWGTCYLNRYKCLWGVSDQTNDVSICDSMNPSFERSLCYFSYAVKNNKPEYCEKMEKESESSFGLSYSFGDRLSTELCLNMVGKPINEELIESGGILGAPMEVIEKLLAE